MKEVELKNNLVIEPENYRPERIKVGVVMPCLSEFQLAMDALSSVQTDYEWTPYIIPNWRLRWVLARSWNYGIESAIDDGCTHIVVINDDILFSPYTIDALVDVMLNNPDVALTSGMNMRGQMTDPFDVLTMDWEATLNMSEHPDFSCFMVTPESFAKIGRFDENFIPAYFEDNDYHYRIKLAGMRATSANTAPFYHYGSRTQNGGTAPVVPSQQFETNREYFARKWGGYPDNEQFTTPYDDASLTLRDWSGQSE